MRKYDGKNKRNIGIIVGFCIIFTVIFSYFLFQQIKLSKIKYELEESTVLFDIDKNNILLNSTGTIKKKWNKKYYLTYKEEQYNIGTHVIAFNNTDTALILYGEFYQINRNSEVNITKEETKLNNLGISRFYKIADRKYLIVDPDIKSEDESLKTTNYLVVELDRQGNAILYNNNLNVKVFSATKILTTTYTFDIAKELLIYDNEEIDLKKILGSTNEYKEEDKPSKDDNDKEDSDGNGTGGGSGTGTGQNPGGTGNGGNNVSGGAGGDGGTAGNGSNNENDINKDDVVTDSKGEDITNGEIIDQTAYTSIIRIIPSTNSISVDYVIYDKLGKYLSAFIEVRNDKGDYNVVHLSKSSTNTTITGLIPGVNYELTFKYTHYEDELVKEETIDTHNVTTLIPDIAITGTKVTNKKIDYKISLSRYVIESAKLRLYINGEKQATELSINNSNLQGSINISNISFVNNSVVELRLEDIVIGQSIDEDTYIGGIKINKASSWSYKITNIIDPKPEEPKPDTPEDNTDPELPEDDKTENNKPEVPEDNKEPENPSSEDNKNGGDESNE